ncbi:hypothetical protein [Bifidobacterium sp.]|uniref:hypothetical protein n=1 Tax=Bifidobacterium sp. TaxID=41200 RepID=UPI0039E90F61
MIDDGWYAALWIRAWQHTGSTLTIYHDGLLMDETVHTLISQAEDYAETFTGHRLVQIEPIQLAYGRTLHRYIPAPQPHTTGQQCRTSSA